MKTSEKDMDNYQKYIHKSRYARYLDEQHRREDWNETVGRLINFYSNKFKQHEDILQKEIYNKIVDLEVMPSMRSLMTAGPALERDNLSGFNCLSGDTLVTTLEYGITEIRNLAGKSVHVVDGNGNWVLAPCKSYGEQQLFIVSLANTIDIRATGNHRWILENGQEKTTVELQEGDRLALVNTPNSKKDYLNEGTELGIINSVVSSQNIEEVFCFEVPTTHSFLLTNYVLTGNCSYTAVDNPRSFSEALFLLMNGCGVGFSVERQFINQLPNIAEDFYESDSVIVVKDSKLGWATALHELITLLYQGKVPKWDLSKLRPAGARLKTFGGRSSGPGPLNDLFEFVVATFKKAAGRKLTSLECHDIMCVIGEIVVVGGVRRCLPHDTLVQIGPDEWKQISDFKEGDRIYLKGEYQKILNVFDQGNQEILKIELADGTYLESTANHRWLVYNKGTDKIEWIKTSDLNENHGMIDEY